MALTGHELPLAKGCFRVSSTLRANGEAACRHQNLNFNPTLRIRGLLTFGSSMRLAAFFSKT